MTPRVSLGQFGRFMAVLATAMLVVACSGAGGSSVAPTADPAKDKLAQVLTRGTLVGYAELDYPPQSIRVEGATRAATTKCLPNQMTAQEVTGFDVETTKLVAQRLGVEACFVQPSWTEVDVRQLERPSRHRLRLRGDQRHPDGAPVDDAAVLLRPAAVPRRADSAYTEPSDLDGKKIGTCTSCTVESYLKGTLKIPGVDLIQKVKDPQLVGFETEAPGIDALAAGTIDAFLTAEPVGLEAVKEGKPLRLLDEPAFSMYPTGFVDKGSGLSDTAFAAKVDEIIRAAHADGTLKAMSMQWFGADYTTPASTFDLAKLQQQIP